MAREEGRRTRKEGPRGTSWGEFPLFFLPIVHQSPDPVQLASLSSLEKKNRKDVTKVSFTLFPSKSTRSMVLVPRRDANSFPLPQPYRIHAQPSLPPKLFSRLPCNPREERGAQRKAVSTLLQLKLGDSRSRWQVAIRPISPLSQSASL